MTRAALYARISRDDANDGLGVARQLADLRKRAKGEGWTATEYVDNDSSASRYSRKARAEFVRMMGDVAAGRVEVVAVAELSRYTREPRIVEDLIDAADSGKVELVSLQGGAYDVRTAEGRMR